MVGGDAKHSVTAVANTTGGDGCSGRQDGPDLVLALAVDTDDGHSVPFEVRLHLVVIASGLRLTARSGVRLNPMRALAADLGGVATGDRDGRCRNVPTNPDGGMDLAIASAASLWRVKRDKPIIGRIAA